MKPYNTSGRSLRLPFTLPVLIAAFSLFLTSCGGGDNKSTEAVIKTQNIDQIKAKRASLQAEIAKLDEALSELDTVVQQALVTVYAVKDTVFTHALEVQGNVETKENILVQPEMPGTLVALNVKAGQKVSRGQILGRIDDGGASQQVAQLQTQYQLAKTTYERQKRLWDQKIGSEIQYLQAQTQMISLQKQVAQAQAQLSKTLIKAPFSGTIDEVFVERGEVVSPGPQGLMRIVNLGNMYVSAAIPETYIGKVKVNTPVNVLITSLGKTYTGKVRQAANSINPTNRSFSIEVAVPNTENLLRPNQVAKLQITDYTNKSARVVPANVIQEDASGDKFVYVVANASGKTGTAKKVIVTTGKTANNVTEIFSGLNPDDLVVTEGVNNISEGMKINF